MDDLSRVFAPEHKGPPPGFLPIFARWATVGQRKARLTAGSLTFPRRTT